MIFILSKKGEPVNPQQSVGSTRFIADEVLNPAIIFGENKSFTLCVRLPYISFRLSGSPGRGRSPLRHIRHSRLSRNIRYSASFATNNASGLMLSNCVPKYMVATYDTRNGSYFSISTFSSARPLP